MANTYVYIDGFNLYYGAVRGTPYKWLDIGALCKTMLPTDNILSIKYFTAKVKGRRHNPDKPIRQQIYFRALKTIPHLDIIHGHFLTKPCRMVLSKSDPMKWVWVDRTDEKGSDVNLASYLLHDGFRGLYDIAVVISNDSDLQEPIRMVRQVLNKPVGIINPHPTNSTALTPYASFIKRIRQSNIIASQFPDTLTDAKGAFERPSRW